MNSLRVFLNFSNQNNTYQNKFKNVKTPLSYAILFFPIFCQILQKTALFFHQSYFQIIAF